MDARTRIGSYAHSGSYDIWPQPPICTEPCPTQHDTEFWRLGQLGTSSRIRTLRDAGSARSGTTTQGTKASWQDTRPGVAKQGGKVNPQQVGRAGEVFVAAEITGGEARRSRSPATCQGSTSSPAISTTATGCGTQTQDGPLITPTARPDRALCGM
jgi:hypothetical protein